MKSPTLPCPQTCSSLCSQKLPTLSQDPGQVLCPLSLSFLIFKLKTIAHILQGLADPHKVPIEAFVVLFYR